MQSDDIETYVRKILEQEFPPCTYEILRNVFYNSTTPDGEWRTAELDLVVITKGDNPTLVQVIEVKTRFDKTNLLFKGIAQLNKFHDELRRKAGTDKIDTITLYSDSTCKDGKEYRYSLGKPTDAHSAMKAVQLRVVAPNKGQPITTIVSTLAPAVVQDVFNVILKLAFADMDPCMEPLEKQVREYACELFRGLVGSMELLPPVTKTDELISWKVL
jgi:hypothetical protein